MKHVKNAPRPLSPSNEAVLMFCPQVEGCVMPLREHAPAGHQTDARQRPIRDQRYLSANNDVRRAGAWERATKEYT